MYLGAKDRRVLEESAGQLRYYIHVSELRPAVLLWRCGLCAGYRPTNRRDAGKDPTGVTGPEDRREERVERGTGSVDEDLGGCGCDRKGIMERSDMLQDLERRARETKGPRQRGSERDEQAARDEPTVKRKGAVFGGSARQIKNEKQRGARVGEETERSWGDDRRHDAEIAD